MQRLLKHLLFLALLLAGSHVFAVGGNFTLTSHENTSYSLADSQGKVVVIAFGYTFCPDICPTALATISSALHRIGDAANQVDPLFISVDPDRDTPEKLGEYIPYFHPRLIGLTGNAETIAEIAKRYYVRYEFVGKGQNENYTVDHTASLYVVDRAGKLMTVLPHGLPPQALADSLMQAINQPTK